VEVSYVGAIASELAHELAETDHPPEEGLLLLYALLVLTRGEATTASDVHDAWVTWQVLQGVRHDANVPFDELSREVREKDLRFVNAIHQVARQRHMTG
jgi:hypothetical protein